MEAQTTPEPVAVIEDRKPVYVVFDTESNGLFEFKDKATGQPIPADAPGQPRLASIATIIADAKGQPIARQKFYVRPDGWSMRDHEERSRAAGKATASEVNGLTDEILADLGIPVGEVLDIWNGFIDQGLIVAAFNAQHDCKMMRAELRRAGRPDRFEETPNTCLMRAMKAYASAGLQVKGFGMVSLQKACEFFGITGFDWHQADADTEASLLILQRLIADGNLLDPKVHYAKGREDAA